MYLTSIEFNISTYPVYVDRTAQCKY